jgi:hypothetical protein
MIRSVSRFAVSALSLALVPAQALATLTPTVQRGERIVQLSEPGNTTPICIIPRHFNREMYSPRDIQKEEELCGMTRGQNVAVCPKTSSTNPGLEFYKVPQGQTAAALEERNCFIAEAGNVRENALKKVAKYKSSISCSYTPSILSYYHVSRILGGAGDVPPSVLRTFDLAQHKLLGAKALQANLDDLLRQIWSGFLSHMNRGATSPKKDALFTDAVDQTYGALILHDGGSEFYQDFFSGGGDQPTRYTRLKTRNAVYLNVAAQSTTVGRDFNSANVQKMQAMKDMADMIVLDTLLNQQDRLGNVDYQLKYIYRDTSDLNARGLPRLKAEKTKDAARIAQLQALGAVQVKVMNLRDNDCGVAKENHSRTFNMIESIRHISPLTYQRLLMLNQQADQPTVKEQFTRGMMFTNSDYTSFRNNLAHAARVLQTNCRSGSLKLDLDAEAHFAGQASNASCEI